MNLGGTDLNPGTFSFVARNASFSVGNRFSVGGTIVISRRPSGDLDVLIGGGLCFHQRREWRLALHGERKRLFRDYQGHWL